MGVSTIHFSVGWGPWPDEPFLDMLREESRRRGLTMLVCKDRNVESVLHGVELERTKVLFHLDMQADYEDENDAYARLGYAVEDAGGVVANSPDPARACQNKAIIHHQFERAEIPVPYTVVVRNWRPSSFRLTVAQRRRLGRPFIAKPARGFGKEGVARIYGGTVREIAGARRFDRGDDFLIQEFVEPHWFGHKMGWFRVFYVFGEVTACWWDTLTQHYAPVTLAEFTAHRLDPLAELAAQIAEATTMRFFSTEIAVVGRGRHRRFVSIDYVNDPCDTTLQSHSHSGMPDVVARHLAERFAAAAGRVSRGRKPADGRSMWFASDGCA